MQEKIISGHQTILYPTILSHLSKETFTFPIEKEKLLLSALKIGNRDKCNELLIEIFDSLALLDTNYIYPSVIYISVSLYNNLNTIIESNTINLNDEFKEFFMSLLHLETLTDMKNEFYTFFDIIIERINTTQDNKSDILVGYITKLITDNYTDPNLCLNSIANSLKMSPTYIGRLFKKSTSKSVAEYITCLRMEQVKYLLDTTDYSINKIVESVGLEKTNYFYTVFKKHFGISLTSYKLELQSKENH
ncbi:MAG: AraC family transcriptional regulator, partial [Cellulosilyticaceae bacterium]